MPFYTNTSGYIDTGGNAARTCSCSGRGPDPAQSGALVAAMRMVVNSKIDAALERAAPIRGNAKGDKPLGPSRSVLSGKAHNATEQAPKRAYRTRWGEVAKAKGKPAPDMPRAPDGLPTKTEVQHVLAAFIGRGGFDVTFTPKSEAGKADELARKLRTLEG